MVIVYSATKGLAAMTLAIAHSRGWLDYEERVCAYWPEFAQQGKERITVRQLLAHQAGLYALDEPLDRGARRRPRPSRRRARASETGVGTGHAPGVSRHYPRASMKTSCCGGSIRSIAAWDSSSRMRSPRRSGLDVYIRLPEDIPNARLATMARPALEPDALRLSAAPAARRDESTFQDFPGAQGLRAAA